MSSKGNHNCTCENVLIKHIIELYLGDCYGVFIPNSEFKVTLDLYKNGPSRIVQFPTINFNTGQYANNLYELNNPISSNQDGTPGTFLPPPCPQNGGYVFTKSGQLPKEFRPTQTMPLTITAASNTPNIIPFDYITNPATPSIPGVSGVTYEKQISGYQIQITRAGDIQIKGAGGTLGNIIPSGPQSILPTSVSYLVDKRKELKRNTKISCGPINIAIYGIFDGFENVTGGNAENIRDTHINDVFDNVVGYAWSDNSNIVDPVNNPNVMNLAYSIGHVSPDGELKMQSARFLPNINNFFVWDTAIAINRTDPKNLVISYLLLDLTNYTAFATQAAVSFDGGITWPITGPTNLQPASSFSGDTPGVRADKFGNFWYLTTNYYDPTFEYVYNQPYIMLSSDKGCSWGNSPVYTFALSNPPYNYYDFPQMEFGGGPNGQYGVHIVVDYAPSSGYNDPPASAIDFNQIQSRVFIPITGLGTYGTPVQVFLDQFPNAIQSANLAVSDDGKVWQYGSSNGLGPSLYPYPGSSMNCNQIVYQSPTNDLTANFAGPWSVMEFNGISNSLFIPHYKAAPIYGFFQTARTILYDNKRKALYGLRNVPYPNLSQDTQLYLVISRNNGESWSDPIEIASSIKNNKGFMSMQLDTKTYNLLIGWYDGRNYKDQSLDYYGAVVSAEKLNCWVEEIPLSNPIYLD